MRTYSYSLKNVMIYLFMGIILLVAGLVILGLSVAYVINDFSGHSHTYHSARSTSGGIIFFFVLGGLLTYFGASNFVTVVKQRLMKYTISATGLICKEYGKELFIPFESLGVSTTELSVIISDRRTREMITITNDLEDFNGFIKLLKQHTKG